MGFKTRLSGNMKKSLCDEENSYHCLYRIVFLVKTALTKVLFGKTASLCKLQKFGVFRPVHNCDPCQNYSVALYTFNKLRSPEWIFMKPYTSEFYEKLSGNFTLR